MSLIRLKPFLQSSFSIRTISTTKLCTEKSTEKKSTTNTNEPVGISKDRSQVIPVETSIKYLKSNAYKETYGEQPVWTQYRRNFKGAFAPKKTRKTCIRNKVISTGNPCPICRDEYLVLSENNPELLQQFICPHTGTILSYQKTGLCQKKHFELLVSVQRARDRGILTFDVPFRNYDYSLYYK
ncbi:28S ribosomal protein S18b, mitochondrial [Chrysoperla carnea]|uniref:28S ribosomal protein S18b, mitochondrial n=1 Tax=Chrysoperla carnea TaxID=189513 RepID=UPI001D064859|nr:28S ribosomal protein S18b, mitochondrial [Chrysoperla carnea]